MPFSAVALTDKMGSQYPAGPIALSVEYIPGQFLRTKSGETDLCQGNDNDLILKGYLTPYAADPASEGEGDSVPVRMEGVKPVVASSGRSSDKQGDNFSFRVNVCYDTGRSSVQKQSASEFVALLQLWRTIRISFWRSVLHTDSHGDSAS